LIGVEKTTFGKILSQYLEARGFIVFYPKEALIKVSKEFELVYETREIFFLQNKIIKLTTKYKEDGFELELLKLIRENQIEYFTTHTDYKIDNTFISIDDSYIDLFDRIVIDMKVFTEVNIHDKTKQKYLKERVKKSKKLKQIMRFLLIQKQQLALIDNEVEI
ncbi:24737_t:CDS:2, partial [Racocetra persica]